MRILVAQINPTVGDIPGNTARIIQSIEKGRILQADLVVFPELALSGYPPEDFILLPHFMESIATHIKQIIHACEDMAVIVGLPRYNPHKMEKPLFNSAAFIVNQSLMDFADKILLPTYDVFDERRYFEPGNEVKVWEVKGKKIGVTICEDIWQHSGVLRSVTYRRDPVQEIRPHDINVLVNLSASPYSFDKFGKRLNVCLRAARSLHCPVLLCNQVGGNDHLIFDGYSLYVNSDGLQQCAKGFVEEDMLVDLSKKTKEMHVQRDPLSDLYQALILGIRDYFKKSGFTKACLGLSGGIDSAVAACLAVEALGPSQVLGIAMPSRFSSPESLRDALLLAQRLEIECQEISIEQPFESYLSILAPAFQATSPDITEENLQARIRGMILMAFSNKFGCLVLSTGNKSELAMGYSTLYGDMCGGLAVLGDVTKRQVYELAHWMNREKEIIPQYTITRPPSAELRLDQKDSDALPEYAIIDDVLFAYVEEHRSPHWISEHFGYPLALVQDLITRIHRNEYKRRQAPPALRVSEKSFSAGRRFPIVQKWN